MDSRNTVKRKMSQDIVADALNEMMNAKRSGKSRTVVKKYSKFLLSVLAIAKLKGYVTDYKTKENSVEISFDKLNSCKAIKPRYVIKNRMIQKYVRRYLPSRNIGILVISTSQGLMTHQTADEKKIGGSAIAYFY